MYARLLAHLAVASFALSCLPAQDSPVDDKRAAVAQARKDMRSESPTRQVAAIRVLASISTDAAETAHLRKTLAKCRAPKPPSKDFLLEGLGEFPPLPPSGGSKW